MSDDVTKPESEIEVKVLLICHKKNQFVQAAQFLARRGVPCAVKGNVREGIQYITKEKPTVVFLSWNLPNSNIVKTYQLITQALKADCVVFAEKNDGKTAAELNNSKVPDVMHAPVSGPGLFMRLQKMIKAKEEAKNNPGGKPEKVNYAPTKKKKTTSARITIKTTKEIPKEGTWEQTGVDPVTGEGIFSFKSNDGQSFDGKSGVYTYKGSKPPVLKSDGTWDTSSGDFAFEAHNEAQDEADQEDDNSIDINVHNNGHSPKYSEQDYGEDNTDPSLNNIDDLLNSIELNADENNPNGDNDLISTSSKKSTNNEEVDIEITKQSKGYGSVFNVARPEDSKEHALPQYEQTKPKESFIMGEAHSKKYKINDAMFVDPVVRSKSPNSILLNQALEALKTAVRPAKVDHTTIQKIAKAKVLNIHSNRFRGYLICVIPMFHELDAKVFSNLKESLAKLLKDQGEELKQFEELNVDLDQIDFKSWSEENAEFTLATLDDNQEIMVSYVPIETTLPQIEERNEKMALVSANDIPPNTKTKFNLFLHLPKNNKFIRYLKQGDNVTNKHSQKFEKHKVDNLHIKKDEIHSFKEYFASNQLQKKSKKKAS